MAKERVTWFRKLIFTTVATFLISGIGGIFIEKFLSQRRLVSHLE